MKSLTLRCGWMILQDVDDLGEKLGLFDGRKNNKAVPNPLSEWEPIPALKHLQLLFAQTPYWGRALRSFNTAPWWYKNEFDLPADGAQTVRIVISNADYYCKVWLNGVFLGAHEGYCVPFAMDAGTAARRGGKNRLVVKVWSPWESEVAGDRFERRTFDVVRHMVKGTYEHDDTFIQRDVNPVGLYGEVRVDYGPLCFAQEPEFFYTLDLKSKTAVLTARAELTAACSGCRAVLTCRDAQTGETVLTTSCPADGTTVGLSAATAPLVLWNTWDHGGPYLYEVSFALQREGETLVQWQRKTGFRVAQLRRTPQQTRFYLNGRCQYLRGTSYFPDVYVSAMYRERYLRDLLAIRAAGFNAVRVHVHVEQDVFYELCSELGIAVLQDSEYNWMHPVEKGFEGRFVAIFAATIRRLRGYPALCCWICLNEPGFNDPLGSNCRMMSVSPGPALLATALRESPNTAVIKGSFCDDDPMSGDSHNYTGSLNGEQTHYAQIDGTSEKLNTEFGFDAPPCAASLEREPQLYHRLEKVIPRIGEIQNYQYALLKYFTEHYRMQKYAPNGGYVQFLFCDVCPQSFYGLYDYWGIPKQGLQAMLESNQPIGIFLHYRSALQEIFAVNDGDEPLEGCTAAWTVLEEDSGAILLAGTEQFDLVGDSRKALYDFDGWSREGRITVRLLLTRGGRVLAQNEYRDLFHLPPHVKGHPGTMSHEFGMRLYEPAETQD